MPEIQQSCQGHSHLFLRAINIIEPAAPRTSIAPSHCINHTLGSHHCSKTNANPRKNRSDDCPHCSSYCKQFWRKCRNIRVNLETRSAITALDYFHLHHPSLPTYCFSRKKYPLAADDGNKRGFTRLIPTLFILHSKSGHTNHLTGLAGHYAPTPTEPPDATEADFRLPLYITFI